MLQFVKFNVALWNHKKKRRNKKKKLIEIKCCVYYYQLPSSHLKGFVWKCLTHCAFWRKILEMNHFQILNEMNCSVWLQKTAKPVDIDYGSQFLNIYLDYCWHRMDEQIIISQCGFRKSLVKKSLKIIYWKWSCSRHILTEKSGPGHNW